MVGLPKLSRNFTSPVDKCRSAIIITNNKIDAVLIKQLSNPYSLLIELKHNIIKFFTACMCFDITKELVRELDKKEGILYFTKENRVLIAVDSNSRSTTWHDSQTNKWEKY